MRISVNTETEELEELRHAVAIIEDAIKRRENPDLYEEDYEQEAAEEKPKKVEAESKIEAPKQEIAAPQQTTQQIQQVQQIQQQQHQNLTVEKPSVEEPKPQIGLKLTQPMSYSQVEHVHQTQKPAPMPSRREERGTAAAVDISALSMSSYGEAREGRKMDSLSGSSNSSSPSSSSFSSTSQSSNKFEPRGFDPRSNESSVKDIITSLRNQRAGQPIQMSEIVSKAKARNISEQETRNLVSKLQREGTI